MASPSEDLLFTNLLLLGLDPEAMEEQYKVVCSPEMFRRANAAGMEVVTHFLLLKLDPAHSQSLKDIWPIMERQQAHAFRKIVYAAFSQLEKDGHLPQNSVRLSHLQTCSGERFVDMLCNVSLYCLRLVMERDYGETPPKNAGSPPASYIDTAIDAMKLRLIHSAHEFSHQVRNVHDKQTQWRAFATYLHTEACRVAELEHDFKQRRNNVVTGKPAANDVGVQRNLDFVRGVNSEMGGLFQDKENMKTLEDAAFGRTTSNRIDGSHLRIPTSVSQSVGPSLRPAVAAAASSSVDIVSLLKLWTASLTIIQDKLMSVVTGGLGSGSEEASDQVSSRGDRFTGYRKQCAYMLHELDAMLTTTRQSADNLRSKIKLDQTSPEMDLVPPTPVKPLPSAQVDTPSYPAVRSTPFVMERLAQSVRRAAGVIHDSVVTPIDIERSLEAASHSLSVGESPPIYTPMSAPVSTPMSAPVSTPVSAHMSTPMSAPVSAPMSARDSLEHVTGKIVDDIVQETSLYGNVDPLDAAFFSRSAFDTGRQIPRTPQGERGVAREIEEEEREEEREEEMEEEMEEREEEIEEDIEEREEEREEREEEMEEREEEMEEREGEDDMGSVGSGGIGLMEDDTESDSEVFVKGVDNDDLFALDDTATTIGSTGIALTPTAGVALTPTTGDFSFNVATPPPLNGGTPGDSEWLPHSPMRWAGDW